MQATDLNQVTSAISVQRWKNRAACRRMVDGAASSSEVSRNRKKGFWQRPRRVGREQSRTMEGKK